MKKEKATGAGTAPPGRDVADPHPANEEHYDRIKRLGGTNPPKNGLGPNPAIHDGHAPQRPDNAAGSA